MLAIIFNLSKRFWLNANMQKKGFAQTYMGSMLSRKMPNLNENNEKKKKEIKQQQKKNKKQNEEIKQDKKEEKKTTKDDKKSSEPIQKNAKQQANKKQINQEPKQDPQQQPQKKQQQQKKKTKINRFLTFLQDGSYKIQRYCKKIYQRPFTFLDFLFSISCVFLAYQIYNKAKVEVTYFEFKSMLEGKQFSEIILSEEREISNPKIPIRNIIGIKDEITYICTTISFQDIVQQAYKQKIKLSKKDKVGFSRIMFYLDGNIGIVMTIFFILFIRSQIANPRRSMGGMFENKAKKFDVITDVKVRFTDVAGIEESKREVQQIVDFLKFPDKFIALGATIPKGVLLTGPPGTGKTLLAKATAGEAGVPFYSVSGSDFVQVFVGVGASRVRQLFQQAKTNSPAIIFIDELDAVGKKRDSRGNDERESTLNQLLVQMDGFSTNNKVIVMAATNRKQILDSALVRPGRFDRQVQICLPDLKGRYDILKVHLQALQLSNKYSKSQYAKRIASLTPGFSGAEIANLCNQAAILAARKNKQSVQMLDFELSSERVIGGVERKGFCSEKERKTVAYHESGHAVVSWFLQGANPLLKVTIIPRSKGALGFAQYFVSQNEMESKEDLMDKICFILGGRCAELFFFKQITTGAYDDLSKAYQTAYFIVSKYGMNSQLGNCAFPDPRYTKPYGENVQNIIDVEIKKIIFECTNRTMDLIGLYQQHISNLAEELLKRETVDVRLLQKILGPRPFPINKTFQAYLDTQQEIKKIDTSAQAKII